MYDWNLIPTKNAAVPARDRLRTQLRSNSGCERKVIGSTVDLGAVSIRR